jgi:nucleotide-binding universal stress UspA family protein
MIMAEEKLLRTILVLADGSAGSINACKFAIAMAKEYAIVLHVCYVLDTASIDQLLHLKIFDDVEKKEYLKDIENTGKRHLEYMRLLAEDKGVVAHITLLKGPTHSSVISEARRIHADALVIGGWRDTRTRMDLIAKEHQNILDAMPCTVIIVK